MNQYPNVISLSWEKKTPSASLCVNVNQNLQAAQSPKDSSSDQFKFLSSAFKIPVI